MILADEPVETLGDEAYLLCRVADELHSGGPLTDATCQEFTSRFDSHAAMSGLVLIGHYAFVVRVANGARIPLETRRLVAGEDSPLG